MKSKSKKKNSKKANTKRPDGINLQHYLINKLRRISYAWPPRKEAIKKARVARGKYKCSSCGGEEFGPKDIQADHTIPVVDVHTGFTDFNSYIERLFCGVDGYSIMCRPCHAAKTFMENAVRTEVRHEKDKGIGDDV